MVAKTCENNLGAPKDQSIATMLPDEFRERLPISRTACRKAVVAMDHNPREHSHSCSGRCGMSRKGLATLSSTKTSRTCRCRLIFWSSRLQTFQMSIHFRRTALWSFVSGFLWPSTQRTRHSFSMDLHQSARKSSAMMHGFVSKTLLARCQCSSVMTRVAWKKALLTSLMTVAKCLDASVSERNLLGAIHGIVW